jgi:hypothetical protein
MSTVVNNISKSMDCASTFLNIRVIFPTGETSLSGLLVQPTASESTLTPIYFTLDAWRLGQSRLELVTVLRF